MTAHITTFYSYKGGVGRTLLLANVGMSLAQAGRRVLLWDLDVEAPGMHLIPALSPHPIPARGFLEWLDDWQRQGMARPTPRQLKALNGCVCEVPETEARLHILPAFGEKADFAALYQAIDWAAFLAREPRLGLNLFRGAIDALAERGRFDHILLDARTGITDLGGLMAAVLPHVTVLVGSYGAQNCAGLASIYEALEPAVQGRLPERRDPARLERLVVVSPVPGGQEVLRAARAVQWDRVFPGLDQTRIEVPYDPRLLFSEDLLVVTDPESGPVHAYSHVAEYLEGFRDRLLAELQTTERALEAEAPERVQDPCRERGQRFEDQMARLLALLEYRVEREQLIDGNRVDLVVTRKTGIRSERFLVECKDHRDPIQKRELERFQTWLQGPQARELRAEGLYLARNYSPAALTYGKAQGLHALTPEDLERQLFDFGPYLQRIVRAHEESPLSRTYVAQRVLLEAEPEHREGRDLLGHAEEWAGGRGRRLWLVLGDYGTGKSAFFRRFAYALARRALEDPAALVPLAIDLKAYPNAISLEGLLQEHLRTSADWHGNPEILLHLLDAGRVVLLLDAFDEMGTAQIGRSVEDQFRQLVRPAARAGGGGRGNRILITCRTHFFRDQQQVKDVTGGLADDLIREDSPLGQVARGFDAEIDELLLFNEEQIQAFLKNHLGEIEAERAWRFIQSTYDLTSLAPRPVLLEMICASLPKLMRQGGEVTPAGLYAAYTNEWLTDRSGGSLQTTAAQRRALLEYLAFELWGLPQHRIHHRALVASLARFPDPALITGLDLDRVDLELRTAAFLTRSNDGYYSFSHKSFQEFFYARYLLRAVRGGPPAPAEALDTAAPTPECVRFLAELMEREDQEKLAALTRGLLAQSYRPRVSENALRLAYRYAHFLRPAHPDRVEAEDLTPAMQRLVPEGARLESAELTDEELSFAWLRGARLGGAKLSGAKILAADLGNADLSGALLDRAVLGAADLSGANLSRVTLREAIMDHADLTRARADSADLTGALLRSAEARGVSFQGAVLHGARLADAKLAGADWQDAIVTQCTAPRAELDADALLASVVPQGLRPFLQLGHTGSVTSACFDPEGRTVLTSSSDHTARLWDAKTGSELRRLEGHWGPVNSASFDPEGRTVLTASNDRTARLWDAKTGTELRRFQGHRGPVFCTCFDPEGRTLLTASHDDTARLWDAKTGAELRRFEGHEGWVLSACFDPEGRTVLTASNDHTARLWDAKTGAELRRFKGHGSAVNAASFDPEGRILLTVSDDRTARLWDAKTGIEFLRFEGHGDPVTAACFDLDGRAILTASTDRTARLWDAKTGAELRRFEGHGGPLTSACFDREGRTVLTASGDGTARLWDAKAGTELRCFKEHGGAVLSACFDPEGRTVLTASRDGTARLWDTQTGTKFRRFGGHRGPPINSACFDPEGQTLLTSSDDRTARLWDVQTGTKIRRFEGHRGPVNSACFDPHGRTLLTASSDRTARLWDAKTGAELRRLKEHRGPVNSACFDPEGRTVLTASDDGTARLWALQDTGASHTLVPLRDGWLSLDAAGRYRAGGNGLARLSYYDPEEHALAPTHWMAEDLPEYAARD